MSKNNKSFQFPSYRSIFILLVIIFVLISFIYLLKFAHNTPLLFSRGIGLFCSPGPLVKIDCTKTKPCVWVGDNKQYTTGDMCHPNLEDELCSPGVLWDCWWKTTPIEADNTSLLCRCWP